MPHHPASSACCPQIRASTRDRPRPLYYCTALNLGLHKARGQPCLLDYLLPQVGGHEGVDWGAGRRQLPHRCTTASWAADLAKSLPQPQLTVRVKLPPLLHPQPASLRAPSSRCAAGCAAYCCCHRGQRPRWRCTACARYWQVCECCSFGRRVFQRRWIAVQHALPAQLGTPCLVAAFAQPAMTNPCLVNSSPRHAHAGLSESLPVFPHVPAASVVLKLRNREANDIFFREMGELCAAIQVGSCVPQHKCGSCAPRYRWAQSPDSPAPPAIPASHNLNSTHHSTLLAHTSPSQTTSPLPGPADAHEPAAAAPGRRPAGGGLPGDGGEAGQGARAGWLPHRAGCHP